MALVGVELPSEDAAVAVVEYAAAVQHVLLPHAFVARAVDKRVNLQRQSAFDTEKLF